MGTKPCIMWMGSKPCGMCMDAKPCSMWGLLEDSCKQNRSSDTGITLATKQMRLITELMYASAPDLGLLRARGLCTLLRFAGSPPGGLRVA